MREVSVDGSYPMQEGHVYVSVNGGFSHVFCHIGIGHELTANIHAPNRMMQKDDMKQFFKFLQAHGALIPIGDGILRGKDILVNRYIYRFGDKFFGKSFPAFFVIKVVVTVEVNLFLVSMRYGADKFGGCYCCWGVCFKGVTQLS